MKTRENDRSSLLRRERRNRGSHRLPRGPDFVARVNFSHAEKSTRRWRIVRVCAANEDGIALADFWAWPGWVRRKYCAKKYQDSDWRHLRTI